MSTIERISDRSTSDHCRLRGRLRRPQTGPGRMLLRPTRVVALALIAVLVTGLVFVRFSPGAGPVVVPEGASAGDLILEPCEYPTENGTYAADCGTLVMPETRTDPASALIALPVVRIRAMSDDPKEPVFFLTGGPGQSNMEFEFAGRIHPAGN